MVYVVVGITACTKVHLKHETYFSQGHLFGLESYSLSFSWLRLCVSTHLRVCLGVFLSFCLPSLSPRLPHTCHLARLTPGSSPPKAHTYTLTHARCKSPPNARPSSPLARQPVSANQLNRLRPENNPMTDSPSGLPLSTQPAWKADSQGTGWTGYCTQEFTLGWAWRGWASG